MRTETTRRHSFSRRPLSSFGKIAIAALLGVTVFCGIMSAIVVSIPLMISSVVVLLGAVLVATGIRWTPLIGGLLSALLLYYFLVRSSFPIYHLTHPREDLFLFVITLLILVCMVVAVGASAGAVLQNYSRSERKARN